MFVKLNFNMISKLRIWILFIMRSRLLFFEIVICFIYIGSFCDNNLVCIKFVWMGCVSDE